MKFSSSEDLFFNLILIVVSGFNFFFFLAGSGSISPVFISSFSLSVGLSLLFFFFRIFSGFSSPAFVSDLLLFFLSSPSTSGFSPSTPVLLLFFSLFLFFFDFFLLGSGSSSFFSITHLSSAPFKSSSIGTFFNTNFN